MVFFALCAPPFQSHNIGPSQSRNIGCPWWKNKSWCRVRRLGWSQRLEIIKYSICHLFVIFLSFAIAACTCWVVIFLSFFCHVFVVFRKNRIIFWWFCRRNVAKWQTSSNQTNMQMTKNDKKNDKIIKMRAISVWLHVPSKCRGIFKVFCCVVLYAAVCVCVCATSSWLKILSVKHERGGR